MHFWGRYCVDGCALLKCGPEYGIDPIYDHHQFLARPQPDTRHLLMQMVCKDDIACLGVLVDSGSNGLDLVFFMKSRSDFRRVLSKEEDRRLLLRIAKARLSLRSLVVIMFWILGRHYV